MPTFMTPLTFDRLAEVRHHMLTKAFPPSAPEQPGPSDIFVPWAGSQMTEEGNIYHVGIAIDACPAKRSQQGQTVEASLAETERFCRDELWSRQHSPFWRFRERPMALALFPSPAIKCYKVLCNTPAGTGRPRAKRLRHGVPPGRLGAPLRSALVYLG